MRAFKVFRVRKDGSIGPLFINRKQRIELGEWLPAEDHPTPGFAHRPGWHCGPSTDSAPHLSMELKSGEVRRWYEVEIEDYTEFQRPEAQGGLWFLANRMRVLHEV